MNSISFREKSIVFIGFMGVGKTTIGQLVAKKLFRTFIDIDKEIEKIYQMPIPQIFQEFGEPEFRKTEKDIINQYTQQKLKIISLGGGAFLQKEIQEICLANCIVFHLDMTWDSWKDRISILLDSRPVLQGLNLQEIEELFKKRQETYSRHNSRFITDELEAEEMADYIIDSLKIAWELYD